MKNKRIVYLVVGALISATYLLLTYVSLMANLAYGPVQFRLSEALTVLPVLTGAAVPGLTIGCLLANLSSPYGIVDIVCGTAATLISAVLTRVFSKIRVGRLPLLSLIMPVLVNALVVGAEIAFLMPEGFTLYAFLYSVLTVGAGEAAVIAVIGVPLLLFLDKEGSAAAD